MRQMDVESALLVLVGERKTWCFGMELVMTSPSFHGF